MLIDGGLFIGRYPQNGLEFGWDQFETYLRESLTTCALGCSSRALFDDMFEGNAETLRWAKASKGKLIPLAVLNARHWDPTSSYLQELKKQGARGFLIAPQLQGATYRQYNVWTCLKKASQLGLPIQALVGNPAELLDLIEATSKLKCPILIRHYRGGGYSYLTDEIAIAKDFKHYFFDVGNLNLHGGIQHLVRTIGSERLYFASNQPLNIEAAVHALLGTEAYPSLKARENVCGKTLARLFKISARQAAPVTNHLKRFQELIEKPKVDTHWHSDGWDILEPSKGFASAKEYMNRFHIEAAGFSSIRALNYDLERGNHELFEAVEMDPRFYAYVVVDPYQIDRSLKLLEHYRSHPRFLGIKNIQDYYPMPLTDSRFQPILEWANNRNAVFMAHIPGLAEAAVQYPGIRFIAAHTSFQRANELMQSGKIPSNVWLDFATSHAPSAAINLRGLIQLAGAQKVLFSSDSPLMSPAWSIGKMIQAKTTSAENDLICSQNALTLFPQLADRLASGPKASQEENLT